MSELQSGVEPVTRIPRQWLSKRKSATVDALLDTGLEVLGEQGFDELSLREVANRAGVTHTTAYSYFSSKEHLVAEVHWRSIQRASVPELDPTAPIGDRLVAALRSWIVAFSENPAVAHGILAAMVSEDPDTVRVRDEIGEELNRRIAEAVGPHVDHRIAAGAQLLFSGAMLQAGFGYFSFDEAVKRVASIVSLWENLEPADDQEIGSRT